MVITPERNTTSLHLQPTFICSYFCISIPILNLVSVFFSPSLSLRWTSRVISNGANVNLVEILLEWNWLEREETPYCHLLYSHSIHMARGWFAASPALFPLIHCRLHSRLYCYYCYDVILYSMPYAIYFVL